MFFSALYILLSTGTYHRCWEAVGAGSLTADSLLLLLTASISHWLLGCRLIMQHAMQKWTVCPFGSSSWTYMAVNGWSSVYIGLPFYPLSIDECKTTDGTPVWKDPYMLIVIVFMYLFPDNWHFDSKKPGPWDIYNIYNREKPQAKEPKSTGTVLPREHKKANTSKTAACTRGLFPM